MVRAFSWLSIRGSELLAGGLATTANQLSPGGTTSIAATTVEEGTDILFLDSPADDAEIARAVAAAKGRPSFAVLSPGGARACPTQAKAERLGFKIGTFPTGMLSPAMAGMNAGLAAIAAGASEAASAMANAAFRETLGYGAYDAHAKQFVTG